MAGSSMAGTCQALQALFGLELFLYKMESHWMSYSRGFSRFYSCFQHTDRRLKRDFRQVT